jgi:hypothetical protein
MANSTAGNFWLLDTAGIVVDTPLLVKRVMVTWKTASAGSLELTTFSREDGVMQTFLYAVTLGAASAAADQMTQVFPIDAPIVGLNIKTIADVAKLIVQVA